MSNLQPERGVEDALRASEIRLRTILNTTVDAFITIDEHGTVESFNPAAERLLGYSAEEVIGRNVKMLMPSPFAEEHDDYLGRYLRSGVRRIIGIGREAVARRKDGTTFPIDLAVGEAVIFGQRIFTGILRDLSERKRLEANLLRAQRMEIVGSLAGGIAHDLNNVLAGILAAADNLELDLPPKERAAVVEELRSAARRGVGVVRQVLAFARGSSETPAILQPTPLLRDLGKLLRHLLPKMVVLTVTVPDGLWPIVGDGTQFYQVLMNLCVNARDAMPRGGALTITAANLRGGPESNADKRRFVRVRVADTGCGISKDHQQHVFEPFYTTKPLGQGTGLGLSTVRDIVTSRGGYVTFSSEVDRGTQFDVYWPAHEMESAQQKEMPTGNGELVLLADRDRSVTELARVALDAYGYRTLVAPDKLAAVELLARHSEEIRAVILDSATASAINPSLSAGHAMLVVGGPTLPRPFTAGELLRALASVMHETGGSA